MRIAFDTQPLMDGQKTGIGFYEAGITTALLEGFGENRYYFNFFSFRHAREKRSLLDGFKRAGGVLRECKWFPATLYRAMWNFIPVPHSLFFGSRDDITHFFNYHVPPGVGGKRVATVHDMAYKVFPETVRFKTKLMLNLSLTRSCKRAHRIVTISEFSKSEIAKYMKISESNITVVPCGVDHGVFRPDIARTDIERATRKYGIPETYLLYLGTLEPRKNIERLIDAYALLKRRVADTPVLVLAGRKGWLYDSIFERVSASGLEDAVLFAGYVDDADRPALLRGALAFVFPSLYEGFGMPPLEAMACGTPVLTSNVSSLPEVVGDAAVLVDPYSVEDIAAGLGRLTGDAELRKALSAKGLKRAGLFTWERSAKILMGVYRELTGERP